MPLPPQFLDELRARISLGALIGRKVKLLRRGREFSGLCPFHKEKTPSFTVSEDKGFFHCFGCGAHGDAIGFVMRDEGLSFPEAVERLAAEAGIEVPRASPGEAEALRRSADILEVLEAAARWFEEQLVAAGGAKARAYLAERGLKSETVAAFRLGYAPDGRGRLRQALNARGIGDKALAEAGLVKLPGAEREETPGPEPTAPGGREVPRDYFFDRVIFPIADRRGRVLAFGGRTLGNSPAKYLNSPETAVFHKGRLLFNLARARGALAAPEGRERRLLLVEGYMDVIALAEAGYPAAVAPLGTAVTETQLQELWRLSPEPLVCLDGDAAGRRAARRAAELALPQLTPGRSLDFVLLPPGEDPDSLVRRHGPQALDEALAAARPLADLLWLEATEGQRFDTPERRAGLAKTLQELVQKIADPAVKAAYRADLEARFEATFGHGFVSRGRGGWRGQGGPWRGGRSPAQVWRRGGQTRGSGQGPVGAAPIPGAGSLGRNSPNLLLRRQEEVLLAALINHPELLLERAEVLAEAGLAMADLDRLLRALIDLMARQPELDSEGLKCHLTERGFARLLADLVRDEVYVHGRFAAPDSAPAAAAEGMAHLLARIRQRGVSAELLAAEAELAESMTEETLARHEPKRRAVLENQGLGLEPEAPGLAKKAKS